MIVISCLDESNGILFNGRRQSRDRFVIEDIIKTVGSNTLWMNSYSYSLFPDVKVNIRLDENFASKVLSGEFCFVENVSVRNFQEKIKQIIIYRWDKRYPQTTAFDLSLESKEWELQSVTEFPGFSHKIIKKEIYTKTK